MKLKVGVTGQNGFIGQHVYNTLGLYPDKYERIPVDKNILYNHDRLSDFVAKCDVIIHLAAVNRHHSADVLYQTNMDLVNRMIAALESSGTKPHVLFSSSAQEELSNLYGKSKRDGRKLFENWAKRSGAKFTGLVIPNVFGPFGRPDYNSFIATFCHRLANGLEPTVISNNEVKLIYIDDLIDIILAEIQGKSANNCVVVPHTDQMTVMEILSHLKAFRFAYFENGIIPTLSGSFELNLFNTFRSYINIKSHFPVYLKKHADYRGVFVEVIKLNVGGQVSFSTTLPNVVRGNHYHTRKIERFAVISGEAEIQLRRIGTDEVFDFYLSGDNPAYVDMPIWHTHNIRNAGDTELLTLFWINEIFNPDDQDTYFEDV